MSCQLPCFKNLKGFQDFIDTTWKLQDPAPTIAQKSTDLKWIKFQKRLVLTNALVNRSVPVRFCQTARSILLCILTKTKNDLKPAKATKRVPETSHIIVILWLSLS